jgi:DHA2 family lincomycin resistance protein-like MFS transporter
VAGAHAAFLCAAIIATVALPLTLLVGGGRTAVEAG